MSSYLETQAFFIGYRGLFHVYTRAYSLYNNVE